MKTSYFSWVEEKYVFKISLVFWHIMVLTAGLSLLGGIALMLWAWTPSTKPSVDKRVYPPEVSISLEELQGTLPALARKEMPKIIEEEVTPELPPDKSEPVQEEAEQIDPAEQAYNASEDRLKVLIPPEKYAWKSKGQWEYPYGKSRWDRYKDPKYRKWKVTRLGVEGRLKQGYKRAGASEYTEKKRLLDAYTSVIEVFEEDQRVRALKALVTYTKDSVDQSVSNARLLGESLPNFSPDTTDFLQELADFGRKNPKDGYAFIGFANSAVGSFDPQVRLAAMKMLILCYYRHFNNQVSTQIETTKSFTDMVQGIAPEYQVQSLENYYVLYLRANQNRLSEIHKIDREFDRDRAHADSVYSGKKAKKVGLRLMSIQMIGGAILAVAMLALILALLSVQREIRKMNERLQGSRP